MQRFVYKALFIASILAVFLAPAASAKQHSDQNSAAAPSPTPPPFQAQAGLDGADEGVLKAIQAAIQLRREAIPAYEIYATKIDHLRVDSGQGWASAWLNPVDPKTGRVVPAEPGLALARYQDGKWQAILPGTAGWEAALPDAPDTILPSTEKNAWLETAAKAQAQAVQSTQTFSGYRLPWDPGKTMYLTQSVHHDAYTPSGSAHYAFDFAAPYDASLHGSPMFAIHAAKAGTVALAEWRNPNGNEQYPNYIVLKDTSTNPVTYQLYLHLAQDSIPPELRSTGVAVQQGQYLGLADDTGQSTGNHLHFQVETNLASYWGQSVDIIFNDVAINGGRPRIAQDLPYCRSSDVCLQTQDTYTSGNVVVGDRTPPRGDISAPAQDGINLTSGNLQISGWAVDDDPGLLSVQILASYGGTWHNLGTPFSSSPFSLDWDLCGDHVPDGPVALALRMLDKNGNQITTYDGARRIFKSYACPAPPPACQPNTNQVALFAGTDFQGACSLLDGGDYIDGPSLGTVGDNQANSIQVGANVQATLYSEANFSGRGETMLANDSNLADNSIGSYSVSSVKVQARGLVAAPQLVYPVSGASVDGQYAVLAWGNGGGDVRYQAKWSVGSQTFSSTWQTDPAWSLGPLPAGSYEWFVRAKQGSHLSGWSGSTFTVTPGSPLPSAGSLVTAPYTSTMESNNWPHTNNWDLTTAEKHNGSSSYSYQPADLPNYDSGVPNAGDLTSPPIHIPNSGYFLRFWYRYETESSGIHWDKRQVMISEDGGASFQELLQLSDDPPDYWLQSPAIDLSAYQGKTVRIRFHFETVDAQKNAYKGWFIDDFSVSRMTQPTCSDANDDPSQATPINYGTTVEGLICPTGDVDYYQFTGKSGDLVGISVHAIPTNSYTLDPYLYLLDQDGHSVLAENDDIVPLEQKDSFLTYRLRRDGTYLIKVKAWDHPGAGGPDARYELTLGSDLQAPSASLTQPVSNSFLPPNTFDVTANANDSGSGINRVDFYWHDQDWTNPIWSYLGSDRDGSDGWQQKFNPLSLPDQKNIAFYVQAVDNAGNNTFAGVYNTGLDRTPPETTLQLASPVISSTAALLTWSGSDNLSGLDHYDLQLRQITGTIWSNWADLWAQIPASQQNKWFIGSPGGQYQFRLRGVDRVGNTEDYPTIAQANFTISANLCKADAFEKTDNDPNTAPVVKSPGAIQTHNFCNGLPGSNWKDDQDWLRLQMKAGQYLIIDAVPQSPSAAIVLELYGPQAGSGPLLAKSQSQDFGQGTRMIWSASQDNTYTLRMRHPNGNVFGSGVQYQVKVRITDIPPIWLPVFSFMQ